MPQGDRQTDHIWLVMIKVMRALPATQPPGLKVTGLSDSDFRVLEVLLHKRPLPVNTIGAIVNLTRVRSELR